MVCLHCGLKTAVVNSRLQKRNNQVWRRRQCLNCEAIFTTKEMADYETAWVVKDSKGKISPFSRDKLLLSLHQSCEHRSNALKEAADLTDTVIKRLSHELSGGSLSMDKIKQISLVTLNRFDKAASVHYKAFHA